MDFKCETVTSIEMVGAVDNVRTMPCTGSKPSGNIKVRHHCILPGCHKQIRKKSDATPITSSLTSLYPILHSWFHTVHNTVVDNGCAKIVSTIVYDRWHKACQRSFYAMIYDGMVNELI
jgi:hypothetical protein